MRHPALAPDAGLVYGTWLSTGSEVLLDAYARTSAAFVIIDCQHSLLSEKDAMALLRRRPLGGSYATIVRASRNDPTLLSSIADAGADGIIVPMIEGVDDARAAVEACLFPPRGTRSFGPIHPALGWDLDELVARVAVMPMVETATALEQIDEICAIPELGGIVVGPADLAIALGLDPATSFTNEDLDEPLARIAAACVGAGLLPGIHAMGADDAARFAAMGYRLLTVGMDQMLFAAGVDAAIRAVQRGAGSGEPATPPR